jgi:DNA-binding PadR family transcriptional regulator
MNADRDPTNFLPLKPAAFHILLSLADTSRHGYGIMLEVQQRTNGSVKLGPGTLYGAIKRLLADELIVESEEKVDRALDDERRRYYSLTELGRRVIILDAERLANLVEMAAAKQLLKGLVGINK